MKTYQKFMTEKKGDTVVFTFGRFNPPTVGHEKLITAVQAVSKTEGGDYFVYPSHSQDNKLIFKLIEPTKKEALIIKWL